MELNDAQKMARLAMVFDLRKPLTEEEAGIMMDSLFRDWPQSLKDKAGPLGRLVENEDRAASPTLPPEASPGSTVEYWESIPEDLRSDEIRSVYRSNKETLRLASTPTRATRPSPRKSSGASPEKTRATPSSPTSSRSSSSSTATASSRPTTGSRRAARSLSWPRSTGTRTRRRNTTN